MKLNPITITVVATSSVAVVAFLVAFVAFVPPAHSGTEVAYPRRHVTPGGCIVETFVMGGARLAVSRNCHIGVN